MFLGVDVSFRKNPKSQHLRQSEGIAAVVGMLEPLILRTAAARKSFRSLFGVEDFPHGDNLNDAFRLKDCDQVQEVVCSMVDKLIRKKVLYQYRVLDRYFLVAIDGTGTISYPRRHCPHCLTQRRNVPLLKRDHQALSTLGFQIRSCPDTS